MDSYFTNGRRDENFIDVLIGQPFAALKRVWYNFTWLITKLLKLKARMSTNPSQWKQRFVSFLFPVMTYVLNCQQVCSNIDSLKAYGVNRCQWVWSRHRTMGGRVPYLMCYGEMYQGTTEEGKEGHQWGKCLSTETVEQYICWAPGLPLIKRDLSRSFNQRRSRLGSLT